MTTDLLRYPIGPFRYDGEDTAEWREARIAEMEALPRQLRTAVAGLTDAQWDTPYRPGGWTVRQVVHHLPDSHMNAYIRLKLALTEENPAIKPYDEAAWANLPDVRAVSPDVSLALLDALHHRWTAVLRDMVPGAFARTLRHPEHGRTFTLHEMLGMYAWHGRHHLAHVANATGRPAGDTLESVAPAGAG